MREKEWEIVGVIFIVLLGSFLHFAFELSGSSPVVGILGAVNESVWEHLKLGFWPAFFLAFVEYPFLKKNANFITAKAASMYIIPLSIVVLFYAYTAVTGHSIFAIDISIFVIAVIIGQIASYKILTSSDISQKWNMVGVGAVVVLAVLFAVFTFYPPQIGLFKDPVTGGYGIV